MKEIHEHGIDYDNNEIYLHGWMDPNFEGEVDFIVANTFIKNIRVLSLKNDKEPILIHMCMCGGYWDYGMAIYDAIKSCPKPTIVLVYAYACSMSSIIPQAATKRIIMPNAVFMMHDGNNGYEGTHKGMVSYTEEAKTEMSRMLTIYIDRCRNGAYFSGWTDQAISDFLMTQMNTRQEWYLSANESVQYGFMDCVLENIEEIKNDYKQPNKRSTRKSR